MTSVKGIEAKMSFNINEIRTSMQKLGSTMGLELGPQCCIGTTASVVFTLALLIIGLASASFSAAGIGYTTIVLGGALFVADLASGNLKTRTIQILLGAALTAAFMTFGALGAASILTANQIGWAILGTYLAGVVGVLGIGVKKAIEIL